MRYAVIALFGLWSLTVDQPARVPLPTGDSENMRHWHEPKAHDGLDVHEHGDAPPRWVLDWSAANLPTGAQLYGVAPIATPNENQMKHMGYKGARGVVGTYAGTATTVEVYIVHHAMTNPLDWAAPRHSWRMWVRDASGNVSYPSPGQMWFGWPDVREHRLTASEEPPESRFPGWRGRGQFILRCRGVREPAYATSEQWYGMMGAPIHFSYTPAPAAALCDPDRLPTMEQAMDMTSWVLPTVHAGHGAAYRRYELSWYGPESQGIEQPWVVGWSCKQVVPTEGAHVFDTQPQWDEYGPVDGPTECRPGYVGQYIAPTMPRSGIYFHTGAVFERTFSEDGLKQPS